MTPIIEVRARRGDARGTLTSGGRTYDCALGPAGIKADKREGDGATPAGEFALRRVLYRADRGALPETWLEALAIERHDGWCDAPGDPAYNRPVRLPYPASAETMWREDGLYDVVVVLGHNDDPVVPGAGSAVFLHCAKPDYAPTEGCVALKKADLLDVLREVGPGGRIRISVED